MGIFDRKKLQKEKKRLNYFIGDEVPSFMITSKLMKLVPDEFQRQSLIERLMSLDLTKQQYDKFIEMYQSDQENSLSLLKYYEINKEQTPFESTFYKQISREIWLENVEKLATVMRDEKFSLSTFQAFIEQLKEKDNLAILSKLSEFAILTILTRLQNKPEFNKIIIKYIDDINNINDIFITYDNLNDTELEKKMIENLMAFSIEEGKGYINNIKEIKMKIKEKTLYAQKYFTANVLLEMFILTNDHAIQDFINDIYKQDSNDLSDILKDEVFCRKHLQGIKQFYFHYMKQNMNKNKLELAKESALNYYLNHLFLSEENGCKRILNDMLKNPENLSSQMKEVLEIYSKIESCKNIDDLKSFMDERKDSNFSITYEELLKECVKFRNKEYSQSLLNPNELKESDKVSIREVKYIAQFDGKEHTIKIITLHGLPFDGLFHNILNKNNDILQLQKRCSASAEYSEFLISNPALWVNTKHEGTKYISMTLSPVQLLRLFDNGKAGITLGFSKTKDNQIKQAQGGDGGIRMDAGSSVGISLSNLPSKKDVMCCYYRKKPSGKF